MSDEHKFGWGLFLFGVVVCVVTALLLPQFVVAALVFAGPLRCRWGVLVGLVINATSCDCFANNYYRRVGLVGLGGMAGARTA